MPNHSESKSDDKVARDVRLLVANCERTQVEADVVRVVSKVEYQTLAAALPSASRWRWFASLHPQSPNAGCLSGPQTALEAHTGGPRWRFCRIFQ